MNRNLYADLAAQFLACCRRRVASRNAAAADAGGGGIVRRLHVSPRAPRVANRVMQ